MIKTLGHYEIGEQLGAGGMGEVFRARDTKLDRDVALKLLPAHLAQDPERMARFAREAKLLASLNHPNIASIFGLEQEDGIQALALELVEGPTLAHRIAQGPIPLEEALPIARQIAEAVEYAHELGIVHRDLKPDNIKLRPDGAVKVLDFGLAKALETGGPRAATSGARMSVSPTITSAGTQAGVILGTATYMAPEQAKGRPVDKRADIWAFGCVLYEMLTARRPFDGETATEVLAAIIRAEPDWSALPADVPAGIRRLMRRAVEKDPKRRLRDIGEARIAIDDPSALESAPAPAALPPRAGARPWLVVALVVAALALGAAVAWVLRPRPAPPVVARVEQTLPIDQIPTGRARIRLALSPDGTNLVYVANNRLYLRPVGSFTATELAGTDGANGPFFSPDGEWIGFYVGAALKKTRVSGGTPLTIAEIGKAGSSWGPAGTSWGPDDTILVAGGFSGVFTIAARGGTPEPVVAPEPNLFYVNPHFLPDGKSILFVRGRPGTSANAEVVVRSLHKEDATVVLRGTFECHYAPTGHLVYTQDNTLAAVPFDLRARRVTGNPVKVVDNLMYSVTGNVAQFAFSESGTLVYEPVRGLAVGSFRLTTVSRSGEGAPLSLEARSYSDPRVSPDGKLIAVHLQDEGNDVWVADPGRGALTRLSFDPNEDETPVWSPDGRSIAWGSDRPGLIRGIYRRAADGSGSEELVWSLDRHAHVRDWAPDGRTLVIEVQDAKTGGDILRVNLAGKPAASSYLQTPFNERNSRLSPDGRWLAYVSDESGRDEVYVQSFPEPGNKVQLSTTSGDQPAWSRDGRTIFYRGAGKMNEVSFQSGAPPAVGASRPLFDDRFETPQAGTHTGYDVLPDGRFLMIEVPNAQRKGVTRGEIAFVFNWFEELKARVR